MTEFLSRHEQTKACIQRPACPKCHARMMLARIMPAGVGFNLRLFECPECEHVREVLVETDAFGMPRQTG